MLRELRVTNIAVIAEARVDLGAGFSVLTGETGAGKSVCINALRAALGGRVDADIVRPHTGAGRATAVFDQVPRTLRDRLRELGVPDDELLTLSRELVPGGRGSCRINGALVSQATLREIGEALADITLQGASHQLLRHARQRELLDVAGGARLGDALARTSSAYAQWRVAESALEAFRRAAQQSAADVARAREAVGDLEQLRLRSGEAEELAAERARLSNTARLVAAAEQLAALSGGEAGAGDTLAAATLDAEHLRSWDASLGTLLDEASLLVDRLRELGLDARRYAETLVLDEARLEEVEERLDALSRVCRRHGSIEAAQQALAEAQQVLAAHDGGDAAAARHESEAAAARAELHAAVNDLSRVRKAAARDLERATTDELRRLGLPHARFKVILGRTPDASGLDTGDGVPVRCTAQGVDDVEFRLVTNPDMLPAPLDQGVSGGELSRLSLALAAVVAEEDSQALVLDEVDSGIGGETAALVGDVLARIGGRRQVVTVTHRPEIAARAHGHLLVRKHDGRPPAAEVAVVDGPERVAEIARLMSGRTTAAALRRADELLLEGNPAAAPVSRAAVRTM